jgi:DNA-binding LacI/PurR family transcriptional regulator
MPPNIERPARPTLVDVARVAGVSVSTASMALRGHPRTASATRQAVREAADKLRYVPDSSARGLRARRTGAVALVIPHSGEHVFSHPYFMSLLQGISDRCNEADMMMLLSTSPIEHDEHTPYLRVLQSRAADGVVVASARLADRNVLQLAASGFPAVFIGRYPDAAAVDAVGVDDRGGALLATDHLIEVHGRTRIAHLSGPRSSLSALDRAEGYRTSLARHDLVYREALVVEGDYDQAAGEGACRRLLETGVTFDGLFAANDDAAVGAMRVLSAAGLRVPEDVAVAGFDDGLLASVVSPSLTTVRQPVRQLGATAIDRLLGLIAEPASPARSEELPVQLVVRASCGCTRSRS